MKDFIKEIIFYIKPYKKYAVLNIVLNGLGAIFSLFSLSMLIPFLSILFGTTEPVHEAPELSLSASSILLNFKYSVSQIIVNNGKESALLFVSLFVMIMIFLKNIFIYFANFFITPLRNGIVEDIRFRIYNKVLKLPLSYYSEERKGDIIARMTNDVQEVEWSILASLEMLFRDPVLIIVFLSSLIYISPELTLFVFILLPVSGLVIGTVGKTLRKTSKQVRVRMGILLSYMDETLSGLRIVKAFNAEEKIKRKFDKENHKYAVIMNKVGRREYLASPLSEFLGVFVIITIMYYGGSMVLSENNVMSPEVFMGYIAIFSQIINPSKAFSSAYYRVQKGMASIDRINDVISVENSIKEIENPAKTDTFNSNIEFNNVSFAYKEIEVLKNINLKVEKGKSLALVGQSGSGKSTLVDLIPRFYDIKDGSISIDSIDIRNYSLYDLRALMGNVNQESILFNDTIFNNIAFGVDSAKEEDVIEAAKVANAHEFISETPDGYQTNIGDRGTKLSGGQRQRISIARAVLKNPPILILDEATSALDTESEKLVQDALIKLMRNRTSIVIAHRLSTVKHADEICVLKEGKIIERGKHDDLIKLEGTYKKLCELQMF